LLSALRQAPRDADLLALYANVVRRLGREIEAISLLQHALAERPGFAPFHNSLGVSLKAAGQLELALGAFERAIELQADYFDAQYNLGLTFHSLGLHDRAIEALRRAIQLDPARAEAHEWLGNALVKGGQPDLGLKSLLQAESLEQFNPRIKHNIGIAYEALGKDKDAIDSFKSATNLNPYQFMSWFSAGNIARRIGFFSEAISFYAKGVEIAPDHLDAHSALNETIWQAGASGYLASYPMAIERMPQSPPLRRAFAHHLNRVRRHEEAEEQARAALSIQPHDAQSLDVLAQALAGQKRLEEAIDVFGLAEKAAAGDVRIAGRLAEAQLRAGQLEPAHDVLSRALAAAPHDQENLARMTIALRLLGEQAAYSALADYERFARAIPVEPPEGFRDMAAFHAELAPYLIQKHLSKQHPTDQTLRGGTQTLGALFDDPNPLIVQLRQRLEEAVAGFVADLPHDADHPFLNRKGPGLRFKGSWSVMLRRGGFHTNHIHPEGWISSAYYITLPAEVSSEADRQGWFKLGETNPDTCPVLPAERWIQPVEGTLILFPSYFWHGTQAFERGAERLTVAFDIVPG